MSSVIKQNNNKVLSTKNVDRIHNCRNYESCPLASKFLQTWIIGKADVNKNKDSHIYYGASDAKFNSFITEVPIIPEPVPWINGLVSIW